MSTSRRIFLQLTAAAGTSAALGSVLPDSLNAALTGTAPTGASSDVGRAPRALRILILGGTGFIGPHEVRYAVERGHHVTVFNRGRRDAGTLPDSVVHLQGDRNEEGGLASIEAAIARGEKWDVVIDNPTTLPHWVRDAGRVLQDVASQYIFISTISVYADTSRAGMDETTPVLEYDGPDPLAVTMEEYQAAGGRLYGPLKAASEREAERWFPGRTTVIRPGLIVGPGDTTGRFTYWAVRLERGGEVLAPGNGHDAAQIIDARDLSEWTVRMAESSTFGTFQATGPAGRLTMAEMLGGIRGALDGTRPVRLLWLPEEFMAEHGIRGWSDMPVWVAPTPDNGGFLFVGIERALAAGLTFRPLATTTRDLLDWFHAQPAEMQPRLAGSFTAEREAAAISAWYARD